MSHSTGAAMERVCQNPAHQCQGHVRRDGQDDAGGHADEDPCTRRSGASGADYERYAATALAWFAHFRADRPLAGQQ